MNRIFVLSDIHGMFQLFLSMLKLIEFTPNDKMYVLGDAVDRGLEPISTLKYIMDTPNIEFVLGNHEEMLLQYIQERKKGIRFQEACRKIYALNGGENTVAQFECLTRNEQIEIEKFLIQSPLYKIEGEFLLVHSGIVMPYQAENSSLNAVLKKQTREDFLWSREEFYMRRGISGHKIIFGHTPTINLFRRRDALNPENLTIWHDKLYNDKIGIDCGAVFHKQGGQLGCLCLNTMEEFYVMA